MKLKATKKIILLLFLIASGLVVSCTGKSKDPDLKTQKAQLVDDEIQAKAETYNKQCPIQIDDTTRLDSCKYLPKRTIVSYFSLSRSKNSPRLIKGEVFSNALKSIQKDRKLKDMRKKFVTFKYYYTDFHGLNLCSFDVNPQDYDKNYFKEKASQEEKEAKEKEKAEKKAEKEAEKEAKKKK